MKMMDKEDMMDGGADDAMENASGHNAGMGNRAVAKHIADMHNNAGKSGNSISSMIAPRSIKHAPGAASYASMPSATSRPIGG